MKTLLLFLLSLSAVAEVGSDILIQGTIGSSFDDKQVKIKDSLGQTYFIPRRLLPKDLEIKQGEKFTIEVSENDIGEIKLLR